MYHLVYNRAILSHGWGPPQRKEEHVNSDPSFGRWLSARRHLLGLTQDELARLVSCSVVTIRKVEADERRPSQELPNVLPTAYASTETERQAFLASARGHLLQVGSGAVQQSLAPVPRLHQRTNLPVPLTLLIGRSQDVAAVRNRLLQEHERLLTLIGPPGIGKTRLSVAVASVVRADFDGGVFFVALAPISDPDLVLSTIAQTLGLAEHGAPPLLERLMRALSTQRVLLVLDNFEQVVSAAPTIVDLLSACPTLKVLTTSRAALLVRGERLYPVPPLLLPDLARPALTADLLGIPSIALFIERARAVQPDLQLSDGSVRAIAMICARLDGLPLAIELVAARARLIPPQALLMRLDRPLTLLTQGSRDLPSRHRTLRSAIAWSYDLLDPPEQMLFRSLGVFVGSWTLEAAEAVCAPIRPLPSAVCDGLQLLLDNSLLTQQGDSNGEPRFTMLETIREYALDQAYLTGEIDEVRLSHAAYYVTLVETVLPERLRFHTVAQQELLEREYDNIRAVFTYLPRVSQASRELLACLIGALQPFWNARGYTGEARRWIPDVLAVVDGSTPCAVRLKVTHAMTWMMAQAEDWAMTSTYAQQFLELAMELTDVRATGVAMHYLSDVAMQAGRYREAEALLSETRDLAHGTDELVEVYALNRLGKLAEREGDYAAARRWFDAALGLSRTLDIPLFAGMMLTNLGHVARLVGDDMEALTLHREGMRLTWEHGWQRSILDSLEAIADLTAGQWEAARTVSTISAAHGLRGRLGMPYAGSDAPFLAAAKAQLGEVAFADAWMEGRSMSTEQAVADALAFADPGVADALPTSTSPQ